MGTIGSQGWTFIPSLKDSSLGSRLGLLLCLGRWLGPRRRATSHHPLGKGRRLAWLTGRFLGACDPDWLVLVRKSHGGLCERGP